MLRMSLRNCPIAFITAMLLVACTSVVYADPVNVSPVQCKPDEVVSACKPIKKPTWESAASLGFNLAQGNADSTLLSIGGKSTYEEDTDIAKISLDYRYGESDSKNNISDFKSSASFKRLLSERVYWLVGTDLTHDDVADLRYRSITYPTLGYFFLKDDTIKLNADAGPAITLEKQGDEDSNYLAGRVNQEFEWKATDTAKLFQNANVTVPFDDGANTLLVAKAGIELAISTNLKLAQTLEDTFDNRPSEGKKKNDVVVITSVIYTF